VTHLHSHQLVSAPLVNHLADWIAHIYLLDLGDRRYVRMSEPGERKRDGEPRGKYEPEYNRDGEILLSRAIIERHLAGDITIAGRLSGRRDKDSPPIGRCIILDSDTGGVPVLDQLSYNARALGFDQQIIIRMPPTDDHDGGHLVLPTEETDEARLIYWAEAITGGVAALIDIRPGNQPIRALFGYHRVARSYGRLSIPTTGKNFDQDDPVQRAEAMSAVLALPLNVAPPAAPAPAPTPCHSPTIRRISPGEQAAERASLADVKVRFNAEHPLLDHLITYGAVQTSSKDLTCPFCKHTHTNTLFIYEDRVFSRSPNCKIPQKRGLDAFGLYVLIEHNDNVNDALKALNPIDPRVKQRQNPPAPDRPPLRLHTEAQAHDATRKRQARQAAAQRLRDDILGRAAIDEAMPERARQMLDIHLRIAGQRGWHRASVARMAELAGYGERWVQRANEYLVENAYLSRSQPEPDQTAVWTLEVGATLRNSTPQTPDDRVIAEEQAFDNRSPVYYHETYVHDLTLGTYEPAAVDAQPEPEPDPALFAYVRGLAWEADEPDRATRDFGVLTTAQLETEAERLEALLRHVVEQPAESSPPPLRATIDWTVPAGRRDDDWHCSDCGGDTRTEAQKRKRFYPSMSAPYDFLCEACYQTRLVGRLPDAASSSEYTGRSKHTVDHATRWRWSNEAMRPREEFDQQVEQLQLDADDPDPEVLSPPTDPEVAARYYALRGKARKATSDRQRFVLNRQADTLMVYVPASEVMARASPAPARRAAVVVQGVLL